MNRMLALFLPLFLLALALGGCGKVGQPPGPAGELLPAVY